MTMCSHHRYHSGNSADQSALLTSRAQFVMRTLLGLLIVSITVSGNGDKVISGRSGQDILLPCNCPKAVEVQWQFKPFNSNKVPIYDDSTSKFTEPYKKRAEIFLAKNNGNCSVLLSNITLGDQGTYECIFGKIMTNRSVTLNVSDILPLKKQKPITVAGGPQTSVIILSVSAASVLLLVVCLITYKRLRAKRENTDKCII